MSANAPPCLPPARRALLIAGLSGLAASGAGYAAHTAVLAAAPDAEAEAERLFARWFDIMKETDRASGYSDEWLDAQNDRATEVEALVRAAASSVTKAAALAIFDLRWASVTLSTTPAEMTDGALALAIAVVEIFQPRLRGRIAEVACDFLAHPDRAIRHCLLFGREA